MHLKQNMQFSLTHEKLLQILKLRKGVSILVLQDIISSIVEFCLLLEKNYLQYLSNDVDVGKMFENNFIGSFCNEKSLSNHLVKSKLNHVHEIPGTFRCNRTICNTCLNKYIKPILDLFSLLHIPKVEKKTYIIIR